MTLEKLAAAIAILRPYYDTDGHFVDAEHDQIYLCKTNKPLSAEDVLKMRALGWFQGSDDDDDADEETGETKPETYDADESWTCYT